jgi:hypothetical protein
LVNFKPKEQSMSVNRKTVHTVVCDKCGAEHGPVDGKMAEARKAAKVAGWRRLAGADLCDKCVAEVTGKAAA